MKAVTVINFFSIRPGKIDEFIELQRNFAGGSTRPNGLLGGRMYRSMDEKSAVLVSQFESKDAQQKILQSDAFKQHISSLRALVESSSPSLYEEAYTTGNFK